MLAPDVPSFTNADMVRLISELLEVKYYFLGGVVQFSCPWVFMRVVLLKLPRIYTVLSIRMNDHPAGLLTIMMILIRSTKT